MASTTCWICFPEPTANARSGAGENHRTMMRPALLRLLLWAQPALAQQPVSDPPAGARTGGIPAPRLGDEQSGRAGEPPLARLVAHCVRPGDDRRSQPALEGRDVPVQRARAGRATRRPRPRSARLGVGPGHLDCRTRDGRCRSQPHISMAWRRNFRRSRAAIWTGLPRPRPTIARSAPAASASATRARLSGWSGRASAARRTGGGTAARSSAPSVQSG